MSKGIMNQGFGHTKNSDADWENFYSIKEEEITETNEIVFESDLQQTGKSILVRGKYLISNCKSGLMVIDAKRAKERIIYQNLISEFIHKPIASQQLLFPFDKTFNKSELLAWQESQSLLNQLGFNFSMEDQTLSIQGIPNVIPAEEINTITEEITETLVHGNLQKGELAHGIIAKLAKNGSANTTIRNEEEVTVIINDLFQCEEHTYTPSGKLIVSTVTIEEIAQKF
jgi:DNA mismatch repair protein MutL